LVCAKAAREFTSFTSGFGRALNAKDADENGSGIALYVAKKIVERHKGGKLIVESNVGKGTTVTIRIDRY